MERLSRWSGIWTEELDRVEDQFVAPFPVRPSTGVQCWPTKSTNSKKVDS